MGCVKSVPRDRGGNKRAKNVGEVVVFVPGLRVPKSMDFSCLSSQRLSKSLVDRLVALRTRVVVMAAQEAPAAVKPRRRATQHGGSTLTDLLRALEEYLPFLLGFVTDGSQLKDKIPFAWFNQMDGAEETVMVDAWYEVLSVLHLMSVLCLSEANSLLIPKIIDGNQPKVSEENRRKSVDILLKAAGYLDCAVQFVLPQISAQLRRDLPADLTEGVLHPLCLQALGQGVDIQLGMAIESPKATLAVKRRLACEMVKYWNQAQDSINLISITEGWTQKQNLFIKWKLSEAKAAAYYYHGLILDEGNTEKSHDMSVAAFQAALEFLKESKRVSDTFHTTPPLSRSTPLWGSMKYLSEKISKDVCSKMHVYPSEQILEAAPDLPDFSLSLKPDDYQLPPVDPKWNERGQS